MHISTQFKSATDFRKSLEARLQSMATETKVDLQRLRRKVAFDRFLARIFSQEKPGFYLKGGYAMELRLAHARATKDIDLTFVRRVKKDSELISALILNDLRNLAELDLNDHFIYQVGKAQIDLENAPYGGSRYPITALIDKKLYVRFQLDVGADFLLDQVETIQGANWLEFCGIPAPMIPMISIEQQFAEKLHTYTLLRGQRVNSRPKDLIDMVLLLNMKTPKPDDMFRAIQKVFKKRDTHPLPPNLAPPPVQWNAQFIEMATECGLSQNMQVNFEKVSEFFNQIITVELQRNACEPNVLYSL
jgi:predicted nucleotidyltransferase component of viral defense system